MELTVSLKPEAFRDQLSRWGMSIGTQDIYHMNFDIKFHSQEDNGHAAEGGEQTSEQGSQELPMGQVVFNLGLDS